MVEVVVGDGQPLFLRGVSHALGQHPQIDVVGEAGDGDAVVELIRDRRPDVALLDWRLPGRDGLAVMRALAAENRAIPVVLMAADPAERLIYEALVAGAHGYLSKHADAREVCDAVVAASRDETTVSPQLQSGLVRQIREQAASLWSPLSPREHEVLTLVARGQQRGDIGRQLNLSPATVKTYLSRVYDKLGVSNRAAATAEAIRRGWLD